MPEQTPLPSKQQRRLENRIDHWEGQVAQRRRSAMGTYDPRIAAAKSEGQRQYWQDLKDKAMAQIDQIESEKIEPMRAEYRAILGLD